MNVTIKEIAKRCGVSEGSVDRALNGRYGIRESTRQRILEVAASLHYMPNRLAQSLATGRTKTIGIVCFDLHNNFFSQLVDIIEGEAKRNGYFIHLVLTHRDRTLEMEGITYLSERKVDGIVLFSVGKGEAHEAFLRDLRIPVLTIYNHVSDAFAHVGIDDRNAMRAAVRHIVSKGYERIVYITPEMKKQARAGANVHTLAERLQGYEEGLVEAGVGQRPVVIEGKAFGSIPTTGRGHRKTAWLCACDTYALHALNHLRRAGVRVPEEMGVMGFDNIDMLAFVHPRLATVEYHIGDMGRQIFRSIHDLIEGKPVARTQLFDSSVVEGETL